jgi:metallophosphoesterase superfamily enzyme
MKSQDKIMKPSRILVIPDLHLPFIKQGALEFCKSVYKKYKLDTVVFTGDIIDNHFTSYHETDPDGFSAGEELGKSIKELQKWHKAFPDAFVCIGNHDRLVSRKALSGGISKLWVKDYNEVLGCNSWTFNESFVFDGILFIHGENGSADKRMLQRRTSIVQGHYHSKSSIVWSVSDYDRIFSMQLGWLGDQSAYAMQYAQNFAPGILNCGIIVDGVPTIIPMPVKPKKKW